MSSGEAKQGEPQLVDNWQPSWYLLEKPKSINLTLPSSSSKMLASFKSLWAIWLECRYSSASIISNKMIEAYVYVNIVSFSINWSRLPFEAYSITMLRFSSSSITSYNLTICRWLIDFNIWISSSTFYSIVSWVSLSLLIILIATFYFVSLWVAILTLPKLPSPMVFPMIKFFINLKLYH